MFKNRTFLNKQEYDYESASDRIFLRYFHRNASKHNLDVIRYNEIKNKIDMLENDLGKIKQSHIKNFENPVTKEN